MHARLALSVVITGLAVSIAAGVAPQTSSSQPPNAPPKPAASATPTTADDVFTIDTVHSAVMFRIQHEGVSNFYGRFNDLTGTYAVDAQSPEKGRFDLQVKTESVDTNNQRRDDHLRSPDFFNAAEFPAITFKSTKVESASTYQLKVTGDLTLHGVTKPVTAEVTTFAAKQTRQGLKSGFEASFTVKRSDFGMDYGVANGGLGDEVTLRVGVEGAKR